MSTLELIVKELKTLPPAKLKKAASYIHGLKPRRHRERLAALRMTRGSVTAEEMPLFERAGRTKGKLSLSVPSGNWRKEIHKRNWRS